LAIVFLIHARTIASLPAQQTGRNSIRTTISLEWPLAVKAHNVSREGAKRP